MKWVSFVTGTLLIADAALAADFSGNWSISASIGGNPATIQCALVQKADVLSGTCKPAQFDPSAITGSVAGASAKWGYDVVFNGNQNHVEYEATLGADGKLTGTLHLGPMPVPFTATRE
jgi:4-hydroxy-3-methylbut-2-enyl diphosphate reductase IspH